MPDWHTLCVILGYACGALSVSIRGIVWISDVGEEE